MLFIDKKYDLFIADSSINPLNESIIEIENFKNKLNSFILSASGWRKVFAISGDEEDSSEEISIEDKYFCALIALTLAKHLECISEEEINKNIINKRANKTKIVIGMDARPTGSQILDIINRVFLALNIEVINTFISAAPEIMALSFQDKSIDSFLYVSASHNPIGHNGIKFGKDGGVFNKSEVSLLTNDFKAFVENKNAIKFVQKLITNLDKSILEENLSKIDTNKEISLKNYRDFALLTASQGLDTNIYLNNLKEKLNKKSIGVIAELNGSARTLSIDKDFFKEINVKIHAVNDIPRQVVHPIVPEGENLEMCRSILEEKYKEDTSYIFGYVPDNDGDRGNLVYIKESTQKAKILKAQEVFALVVLSELSAMRVKYPNEKMAISINGPTSMRIDEIANALDVEVFRTEVGEANVVEKAKELREKGYIVRIFGEGSNGGNITHPAKVRDPLNTILSIINLLTNKEVFDFYRKRTNYTNDTLSIENFINSLPKFITTDAFSKEAKLNIRSEHGQLKENYEKLFLQFFESNKQYLKETFEITKYKVFQMEGSTCIEGIGKNFRTPPYRGGYKIIFYNSNDDKIAFIWMRGSGTEAVFRLLVDVKNNSKDLYTYLLNTHNNLLKASDE